jgi:hypothetical protein
MSASTTLAAAIADGDDGLSERDLLVSLAYAYSGGVNAQSALNAAIANGYDKLSEHDLIVCIDGIFNP